MTDPHPTDPHPTDPHPTDRQPNDPHPTDPHPTDPHRTIVEIRVHGVSGTAPASLLDTPHVIQVAGDGVGRIFRPADELSRPLPIPRWRPPTDRWSTSSRDTTGER
ncbi:hypothetical protein M6D93_01690 [Jatrophihabitans telluris]|uniref:Uncharacterized protein n=1 Tax=Jatrophihabitans telluris TaxID=2038343 RepID=A0ABY4QZT4_9ACTN|nr:hypothetical protein [Jatrophihabitans telluris]UQX88727.1 hypothetical protein M6D93_01690 [Jatrophihabitans telluris]